MPLTPSFPHPRRVTIKGTCPGNTYVDCPVQEAAKLNQCTGVWVEDSDISGGWNAAFDCVACQYGHVLNSTVSNGGWCLLVKGGSGEGHCGRAWGAHLLLSAVVNRPRPTCLAPTPLPLLSAAYWLIAGNEVRTCGDSGISAGQGAGFNYQVQPWTTWDAVDVKARWCWCCCCACCDSKAGQVAGAAPTTFNSSPAHPLPLPQSLRQIVNNVVRDVRGAGLGVWGCYDCLLAHNTLSNTGRQSHTMEINYGTRVCGELSGNALRCACTCPCVCSTAPAQARNSAHHAPPPRTLPPHEQTTPPSVPSCTPPEGGAPPAAAWRWSYPTRMCSSSTTSWPTLGSSPRQANETHAVCPDCALRLPATASCADSPMPCLPPCSSAPPASVAAGAGAGGAHVGHARPARHHQRRRRAEHPGQRVLPKGRDRGLPHRRRRRLPERPPHLHRGAAAGGQHHEQHH